MPRSVNKNNDSKKWKWYHGVLFYAGVQAATFGFAQLVKHFGGENKPTVKDAMTGNEANNEFYNNLKQPVFAPPDWMFPVAWTINNASCIYGLLRVANLPEETEGRTEFINLQLASWVEFCLFNGVFFGYKSPVGAAALTLSYTSLTVASLHVAMEKLKDKPTALSLASVSAWLAVAAPTSLALAAWNDDEFFGLQPAVEPPRDWIKNLN